MDLYYSNSNDSQVSPIDGQNFIGRYYPGPKTKILVPYASSDSSGAGSSAYPLVQYLHSSGSRSSSSGDCVGYFRSPLSSFENVENPPVFRTPVKAEEDVVVMDGILIGPKYGAKAKSLTSDSGGRYSSSSTSGSENNFQKSEAFRQWEDSGTCRFGSKCRFVHGKEHLRPAAFANWDQSEAQIIRSHSSGSYSHGARGRFVQQQGQSSAATPTKAGMFMPNTQVKSVKEKEPSSSGSSTTSTSTSGLISSTDWCPLDDNIELFLPPSGEKCTSRGREDVNAHIHNVLYGPSGKKRLPVFIALTDE